MRLSANQASGDIHLRVPAVLTNAGGCNPEGLQLLASSALDVVDAPDGADDDVARCRKSPGTRTPRDAEGHLWTGVRPPVFWVRGFPDASELQNRYCLPRTPSTISSDVLLSNQEGGSGG